VRGKRAVALESLLAIEKSRPPPDRSLRFPKRAIGAWSATISHDHETAWRIASVTFGNEQLFNATRFLQRSYENFFVFPGGVSEVVSAPCSPSSGSGQNNFEDALHNAFKAIEAVIGDPPKDDRRFSEKLAAIGIDPQEPVGYQDKIPIADMVRRMNTARDKRSAHGSTRNRGISSAELLDFQACAGEIVMAALEKARGSPLAP
jgi:hypothetical protein